MSNDFNLDGFSFTPDAQEAQGYPRIYWRNGAKQAGQGGFFYASSRDFADLGAPWESVELYDDEPGSFARCPATSLRFSVDLRPVARHVDHDPAACGRLVEAAPTSKSGLRRATALQQWPPARHPGAVIKQRTQRATGRRGRRRVGRW